MKSMKKRIVVSAMLITALCLTACGANGDKKSAAERDVINQVSLLQGLTLGDYNGSVTAAQLKEKGDIGIGTFNALNGELIMLDGVIYRAAYDGSVEKVADTETIPFSNVTFFDADHTMKLNNIANVNALKEELNKKVNELGSNNFYMIKVEGTFDKMQVRSELPQNQPYKPLAEVLKTDQTVFDYDNVKGTIVGLYCPNYMDKLNAVGWHFHFISEDKTKGGHILECSFNSAEASFDVSNGFAMTLPNNEMFNNFDLTVDQSNDIKKVETGEEK